MNDVTGGSHLSMVLLLNSRKLIIRMTMFKHVNRHRINFSYKVYNSLIKQPDDSIGVLQLSQQPHLVDVALGQIVVSSQVHTLHCIFT